MQQTYDRKIMERFMTHPELDAFDKSYCKSKLWPVSRVAKAHNRWYYTHEEIKREVDVVLKELGWKKI